MVPYSAEPSSVLCLSLAYSIWEGKTAELQKGSLLRGSGNRKVSSTDGSNMSPGNLTVARDHHRGLKSAWVYCELWRTLLSTSKPPEKDILWLQDPLGRGLGVKQSVVGGLGVNRQREDESGVESCMQPATS